MLAGGTDKDKLSYNLSTNSKSRQRIKVDTYTSLALKNCVQQHCHWSMISYHIQESTMTNLVKYL